MIVGSNPAVTYSVLYILPGRIAVCTAGFDPEGEGSTPSPAAIGKRIESTLNF